MTPTSKGQYLDSKLKPIWTTDCRYIIVTGGRGSGKSFGVHLHSCYQTYEQHHRILFTRFTMSSAHISIVPEFVEKINLIGDGTDFKVNKTDIQNLRTGNDILFRGIKTGAGNQTANLKSLQGISTWVLEEAEELQEESTFDAIDLSVRSKQARNRIILILNPTTKEHFIYKRFFEAKGIPEGFNGEKDDVCYIHINYESNKENLSNSFIKSAERMKKANPQKYKHVMLGGWLDKAEGVIFKNWEYGAFDDSLPSQFGQDYGYSNDPTTLVKVAIDKDKKRIYLHECLYLPELDTNQIYKINLHNAGASGLIIGDNAEPRLIKELKSKGLNIRACKKFEIKDGIRLLLDYQLIVSETSKNLVSELNNYRWHDKKSETPIDDYNHILDAIRYAVHDVLGNPNQGKYFIY